MATIYSPTHMDSLVN